jgi:hypothetical protein
VQGEVKSYFALAEGWQKLIDNIVGVAKISLTYGLPIVHSTVNVKTLGRSP